MEAFEILSLDVVVDGVTETQFVVMHSGEMIGRVGVAASGRLVACVRQLYVDPYFREMGVGTMLMRRCIERARQCGCGAINLAVARERGDVAKLVRFYERLGFWVVAAFPDEFSMAQKLTEVRSA